MERPERLADLIERNVAVLTERWSARAVEGLGERLHGAALVDHLPELLDEVARSLRAGAPLREAGRGGPGRDHGRQRHRVGADLDQVVREYALLRTVILDLAEESRAEPTFQEMRILGDVLGRAISESVTEYVATREAAHREAGAALRESEERYRTLFTNMAEGFALGEVVCDAAGRPADLRFLEMNAAFERQTGLARETVRGRRVTEVLPHLEPRRIQAYGDVALGGAPVRFEEYDADLDRHFSVFCYSPAPGRFAAVFTDVTERRRAEAEVRESEVRLRELAEAMPQMVWTADARGRLDYLNGRWLAYTGASPEAALETAWEVIHPDDVGAARERWAASLRTSDPYEVEYRLRRHDGAYRWHLARGVPVRGAGERVARWFGTTTDIHDLKQLEDALRESDRRKSEFLGVLSHELRNPLAPIRNSIFVLERAPDGDRATHAKEVIRRQTEHLARLIDDLLDVTRISRGKIELRRGRVDLDEVVRRAAEDHRSLFEARDIALAVEGAGAPVWVDGDATRLAQIVGNLLQNAAKFSEPGGHAAVSVAAAGDAAEIRVRDDGAGIDPALGDHLFEPFAQAERTLARSRGGLGLGLALVKGLAELHGGSVEASSDGAGRGAEFTVRLPLSEPAAPRPDRPAPREVPPRRVLVVDDNHDAADTLAELVGLLGHEVEVAYDGPSAIAKARARPPDLVLCDIGLPGMSGYDVARELKNLHVPGMRLVAVSGYARPDDLRDAAAAGFDRHVAKPPRPEEIAGLLQ